MALIFDMKIPLNHYDFSNCFIIVCRVHTRGALPKALRQRKILAKSSEKKRVSPESFRDSP